jgi:hypothetical protein
VVLTFAPSWALTGNASNGINRAPLQIICVVSFHAEKNSKFFSSLGTF